MKRGDVVRVVGTHSNKGFYEWNVPSKQPAGKDYTLRLVNGRETVSSQSFAITSKIPMWVKIGVPVAVVGAILLLPKSSSGSDISTRLTAPPDILN